MTIKEFILTCVKTDVWTCKYVGNLAHIDRHITYCCFKYYSAKTSKDELCVFKKDYPSYNNYKESFGCSYTTCVFKDDLELSDTKPYISRHSDYLQKFLKGLVDNYSGYIQGLDNQITDTTL